MIYVELSNEAQFADLQTKLYIDDVTAIVRGPITISKSVGFHGPKNLLFYGVGSAARFNFTMKFEDWSIPGANGFEFNNNHAHFENIQFHEYEGHGSCLKRHGTGDLTFNKCGFYGIGTNIDPFRTAPPVPDASHNWSTQVIGGSGKGEGCKIIVKDTMFYNCATDSRWSHCVYVGPEFTQIQNCTFQFCGSPFAFGGSSDYECKYYMIGNKFIQQVKAPKNRYDDFGLSSIFNAGTRAKYYFIGNLIEGPMAVPFYRLYDNKLGSVCDMNTYRGTTLELGMSYSDVLQRHITKEEWLAKGYDRGSLWL